MTSLLFNTMSCHEKYNGGGERKGKKDGRTGLVTALLALLAEGSKERKALVGGRKGNVNGAQAAGHLREGPKQRVRKG